jgi:diguanylate cyclase (GGDEF)-like protein
MRKKLETFLFTRLSRHAITNDHEKYLYLISFVACTYAISMHFFVLLFHFIIKIWSLFIVYLISILIDLVLFWLVEHGRYLPFGLLLSGTIIVNTLVSALCIGTKNLVIVYLLVTLMMQMIIPYGGARVRALVIGALWVSMVALILVNVHLTPLYDIGHANSALAMFNIHLVFFGTIIQLTIGNTIWDAILKFNRAELEKSKDEANTDPLTGLFNRRYAGTFFDMLTAGKLEQVWCVAMLDIDDFKFLNDAHGHLVGDDVLMFISDFLRSSLRRTDLLFRWGGEEFLILLKDADISAAFRILDNIRAKLASENIETHAETVNVTVTIGVCPLDIDDIEQSIDRCDRLMYVGKELGKNRVVM